jgi:chromosome segregation ATPase
MMTPEIARERLAAAEAGLEVEERRLAAARAEVEGLAAKLEAADPDSKGFETLVSAKVRAEARVTALAARAEKAGKVVEVARQEVDAARRAAAEEQLAELRREIDARSGDLTAEARVFRDRLRAGSDAITLLVTRANEIVTALDRDKPNWRPAIPAAGSVWSGITAGWELGIAARNLAQ